MWENIAKPICLFLRASLRRDIMALCSAEVFLKGDKPVSVEHLNNKKQFELVSGSCWEMAVEHSGSLTVLALCFLGYIPLLLNRALIYVAIFSEYLTLFLC